MARVSPAVCATVATLGAAFLVLWSRERPLRAVEIVIERPDARLVGSLYLSPAAPEQIPVVVVLHGSGSDGRGNRYYRLLAQAFAEAGYGTFVYDKRGCGGSSGSWIAVPFQTLADDGVAVVARLKQASNVDPARIVVWGGSEGGTIAAEVAVRSGAAAVIAQSASGVPFWEQNRHQNLSSLRRSGFSEEQIAADMQVHAAAMRFARTGLDGGQYLRLRERGTRLQFTADLKDPWWRWYGTKMDYEPTAWLKKLGVPILAVWGDKDLLVPVDASREAFKQALSENANSTTIVIGDADHSLSSNGRLMHLSRLQDWLRNLPTAD